MKKLIILSLFGLFVSFSSFAIPPITGTMGACVGGMTSLTDADSTTSGGTWSSSNTMIATVSESVTYATVGGVSAGVATITYTLSGSYVTASVTVTAAPAAITGTTPTCVGTYATLSDATAGGSWSSSNYSVASVTAAGVVTGVGGGTAYIIYTVGIGCSVSIAISLPTITMSDSMTGPSSVCVGSTITLADATTGGTWSSGSTAIATVSSGGVVTGVSAGSAEIIYTVSSVCAGSASAHSYVTVTSSTSAGAISGSSSVMVGAVTTLTDGIAGGTWSSSNTAIATVDASTGAVTGVATGTVTITYTVSSCGSTPYTTTAITVTAFDGISGYVNFAGASYTGDVFVWLITYNPATLMLEAADSVTVFCSGTSVYYQFTGMATDSFRVKAATYDDTVVTSTTGYVPTYHTSSFYWHDADVIYHVSGTGNTNEDINMAAGTVTSGPGFIGGLVTSGANRGTSTGAPVVGLLMYLQNSTTGDVVQQTLTDATGNYTFGSLPYGSYFVYPELINYATTPYTSISLSAANPSVSTASFMEHTVSLTITPVTNEAVSNTPSAANSVVAFPNPTSGKLNILWQTVAGETGTISVADITGRVVYTSAIQMNAGSGIDQVDLSSLTNGLYLISVKSASISYNGKVEIQH